MGRCLESALTRSNVTVCYVRGTQIIESAKTFLEHCYTTKELEMISKHKRSSATNFCGKEAVVKAFGTGFRKITPNEIEILRNESGAPYVLLYGRAKDKADQIGVKKIPISLADTKTQAIAFVVLLG